MRKEEALVRIIKDKQRFYIKRSQPQLKSIAAYQKAYLVEAKLAHSWKHPNLFTCIGLVNWEGDKTICYKYEAASPLNKMMVEEPESMNKEVHKLVNQLMDAVGYIHKRGTIHADIHPENIYITKSEHQLKLINCAQPYLNLSPSFHLLRPNYTAPEFLEGSMKPNAACDIYAIGKVIEYVYSYSRVTVGISRIIKKATHTDPKQRYASVVEMKAAFNKIKYWDWGMVTLKASACVGAITFFFYLLAGEKPTEEDIFFFEESKIHQKSLGIEREKEQTEPTYMGSPYVSRITPEVMEGGRDRIKEREINENLFKKEFKKAARPIIQRIYTPQLMNGNQETFQQESLNGFEKLDEIQKSLANELGLSLSEVTILASDIVSDLTKESLKKLDKAAME